MAFIELDIPAEQHDRIRLAFAVVFGLEPDDQRIDRLMREELLRRVRGWVIDAEAGAVVRDLRRQVTDEVREQIVIPETDPRN